MPILRRTILTTVALVPAACAHRAAPSDAAVPHATLSKPFTADSAARQAGDTSLPAVEDAPRYGPPDTRLLRYIRGSWGWTRTRDTKLACTGNPHAMVLSPDRRTLVLRYRDPVDSTGTRETRYQVRGFASRSVRLFMDGETRRTPAGELVVWDLVFLAPDLYTWHRTDWPAWHTTEPLELCERETPAWGR